MSRFTWPEKFGFTKNPFKDTLETGLFFRTRQHEEALVKISLGIDDRHALILLFGKSGTGKTMVSQVVLSNLEEDKTKPVFVYVYPGMGKGALLGAILKELDVEKIGRYAQDRLEQLQEVALNLQEQGRRLIVFIDEAHFLKADGLHLLRTLSNIETEEEKLITVMLIGEESLRRRLTAPSYISLRSRITFTVNLSPLTFEETEQYIKFRLLKCGGSPQLLTPESFETVFQLSGGIPREINRLLYNGFLEAMSSNGFAITPEVLERAGQKMGYTYG